MDQKSESNLYMILTQSFSQGAAKLLAESPKGSTWGGLTGG